MKTRFVLMMTVVVAVALTGVAFAADTPAAAPAKPATAAPAAAPATPPPAHKAPEGVKATVKGTVSSKTINRKGQDIKVYEVTVTSATGADGKALDNLKGAVLHLGPKAKVAEIEKFDGKTAEITGLVVEGKRANVKMMRVESIK